jgi:hypothetical protein
MKTPVETLAEIIAPYLQPVIRGLGGEASVAAEVIEQLQAEHVVLAQSWTLSGNVIVLAPLPDGADAKKMVYVVEPTGDNHVSIQAIHPENVSA